MSLVCLSHADKEHFSYPRTTVSIMPVLSKINYRIIDTALSSISLVLTKKLNEVKAFCRRDQK